MKTEYNRLGHCSSGAVNGAAVGALSGIGAGLVMGWLADRHYVRIEIVP